MIGWASVILALTSWPSPPEVASLIPGTDKVVHFAIYAVLGALVARALLPPVALRARLNAVTAMVIFGFVDELHQLLIPGRAAGLGDWTADAIGAATGLLAGLHFLSLARRRQELPT